MMNTMPAANSLPPPEKPLDLKVAELRVQLQGAAPAALAARTGSVFHAGDQDGGRFELRYWDDLIFISHPDFVVLDPDSARPRMIMDQALILSHFQDADGTPASSRWIAFSELPNGTFYAQAFQGYTGQVLLREFGGDSTLFEKAGIEAGGRRAPFADLSFAFDVLPHLSLLAACWLGDEDFPPSYRILFDASAPHQLSTDGCAILGSMLTRRLVIGKMGHR